MLRTKNISSIFSALIVLIFFACDSCSTVESRAGSNTLALWDSVFIDYWDDYGLHNYSIAYNKKEMYVSCPFDTLFVEQIDENLSNKKCLRNLVSEFYLNRTKNIIVDDNGDSIECFFPMISVYVFNEGKLISTESTVISQNKSYNKDFILLWHDMKRIINFYEIKRNELEGRSIEWELSITYY